MSDLSPNTSKIITPGDVSKQLATKRACHIYASFMKGIPEPVLFLFFFTLLVVLITVWLNNITPKDENTVSKTVSRDVEATAIPEPPAEGEEPPPYQTETTTPAPVPVPVRIGPPRSSAHSFVYGSALVTVLLALLVLLALDIQTCVFCYWSTPVTIFWRVVLWILYAAVCLGASTGVSCWMMLVRDLWGPGMKKKWKMNEMTVFIGLVIVPMMPVFLLGQGCVSAIEACQRRLCGDVLQEEKEERERVELELRDREGVSGGGPAEASGSASEGRDEESVGLIAAAKSEQI